MLKGILLTITGGLCLLLTGVYAIGAPGYSEYGNQHILNTVLGLAATWMAIAISPIKDPPSIRKSRAVPLDPQEKLDYAVPVWVGIVEEGDLDFREGNIRQIPQGATKNPNIDKSA